MAGIEPIYIPLRKNELSLENIRPYFLTIMTTFNNNARKVQKFRKIYENQHEIEFKKRRYDDDSDVNNKVATPHLWAMVNFKTGYAFGNPKEYSQSADNQTDDIKFLNKYNKDANLRTIDKDVGTEIYAVGNCYYFIEPKDNLKDLDLNSESPYVIYCKPSDTCAKVYSSYNGNEELFDILVTKITDSTKGDRTIISIYLPDTYYEVETYDLSTFDENKARRFERLKYKELPLVEKYANNSRIGIVEIGETLQDAIDTIYSNEVDNIVDVVNELLVFKNCVLGKTQDEEAQFVKTAKKNGVIVLNDRNPDVPAGLETISTKLNHSDILNLLESIKNELYSSCGVPLATSDTSNGGNKQGALQLGNGWENAYNRLLDEINSFIIADNKLLRKILFICKKLANSRLNTLNASEIEIKYNPNMTDNMLSKAQAYNQFVTNGVPPQIAIEWCRLSNDPISKGKIIQDYMDAQKEQDINSNIADNIELQ